MPLGNRLRQLLSHILDLIADIFDEESATANFLYVETVAERVAFDGTNAIDEVLEVGAEVVDGGGELGAGFGQLGGGRGGGRRADAEVRSEQGPGGLQSSKHVPMGVQLVSIYEWMGVARGQAAYAWA